jgi:hypothetical protein
LQLLQNLLGLDISGAKSWIKNTRYKLKVERDTNYPKFLEACRRAQVACPEHNQWLEGLKQEVIDLDNLPSVEEQPETYKMVPPSHSKMMKSPPVTKMNTNSSIVAYEYGSPPVTNRHRGLESFDLTFQTLYQEHSGFAATYLSNYSDPDGKVVYDYFEVMRFAPDCRDVLELPNNKATVSAKLLEDGSGMVVSEPMMPTFLWNNLAQMHEEDAFPQPKKVDFIGKIQAFEQAGEKQTRHTTIYFPDNIIGTTEFIGSDPLSTERSTDLELFLNIFNVPLPSVSRDEDADFLCYYAYWKIGVKGTAKKVQWGSDSDPMGTTMAKLGKLGISKPKKIAESKNDFDVAMY